MMWVRMIWHWMAIHPEVGWLIALCCTLLSITLVMYKQEDREPY
jgi:hypothetical protein